MKTRRDLTLTDFRALFLGQCQGIGLLPRGTNDPHVCFHVLTHDDGNWFVSESTLGASCYWLTDLSTQIKSAITWLEANAEKDGKYGWKFQE